MTTTATNKKQRAINGVATFAAVGLLTADSDITTALEEELATNPGDVRYENLAPSSLQRTRA